VRSCVTKKLTALLGVGEEDFEKYFDIHDLVLDDWNSIDGLEVKPMLSPHPVETTTVPDSFHNTNSINGFRGMFGLNKAII